MALMDPLSQLPLECLHHILRTLTRDNKQATLATLLQVNKYFAFVTLPFLYNAPFRQTPFYLSGLDANKDQGLLSKGPPLTATLLYHLNNLAEIPKVVLLAYGIDTNTNTSSNSTLTSPPSSLNYLEHIRHLEVVLPKKGNPSYKGPAADFFSDKLKRHLTENEFATLHRLDLMIPKSLLSLGATTPMDILKKCLWVILRREVCWAIARPILEQLQSLVIPLSDLDRYADAVDRLSNLEHIRFFADDIRRFSRGRSSTDTKAIQARRNHIMSTMLQFIKAHVRLFKGLLKSVQFYSKPSPDRTETLYPPLETRQDILRLLPPLHKLTSLGPFNWMQFVLRPLSTELDRVVTMTGLSPPGEWFRVFCKHRVLLQRCRSLETLEMTSLGQGCFNWGVQEKIGTIGPGSDDDEKKENTCRKLVPLANVTIKEGSTPFTDEIDDIAIAFSQTLERLTIETVHTHPSRILHIGQGWSNLFVLTHIDISCNVNRLLVDSEFYTLCPNISVILLTDDTIEYQCQDIVPCRPAQLAKLTLLRLIGWSALTFHPATLEQTTQLQSLVLSHNDDETGHTFIPPIHQLDQPYYSANVPRPCWTWDWYLPHLWSLCLAGEIAYRFEFRMLQGCQALADFSIDMNSANRQHTKIISKADLFVTSSNSSSSNNEVQQPTQERIVVPTLKTLTMRGAWIMEDEDVLPEFLTGMFPNLEWLLEQGEWGGPTVGGLVNVIRTTPSKIQDMVLFRAGPSPEEVKELGVFVGRGDGDCVVRLNIIGMEGQQSGLYGLLREIPL